MKLFYSTNSPYARKCRIVLMEKELTAELINVNPMENSPELLAINPLGTVPAFVTDQGLHLCDSTVICEYLDSLSDKNPLLPEPKVRECVLAFVAMADGIMDAAVACVLESRRPEEKKYPAWVERKQAAIMRTIDKFAAVPLISPPIGGRSGGWQSCSMENGRPHPNPPPNGEGINMGSINLAVALAYVDFRLPNLGWRAKHPKLAAWLDNFSKRPSFEATKPVA